MIPLALLSLDWVDWLLVNKVSKIVVKLTGLYGSQAFVDSDLSMQIFHRVNPSAISWSCLTPTITSYLWPIIPIVPWATWLSALEASEQKGEYNRNPAIKILDFYRNVDKAGNSSLALPGFGTKATRLRSEPLYKLRPVNNSWMSQ